MQSSSSPPLSSEFVVLLIILSLLYLVLLIVAIVFFVKIWRALSNIKELLAITHDMHFMARTRHESEMRRGLISTKDIDAAETSLEYFKKHPKLKV